MHSQSVIQSQIHYDSIFITSYLLDFPQKFYRKKHLSLSRCHVTSLPAIFLSKGKVHGPLCYPIYFVHIIVSFVLHTTSVDAGFDDSSIDEHTIGIRDFSQSLPPRSVCLSLISKQCEKFIYWRKKHAERFLKHKFQNVDPFLSAFHLNGLSDKRASSLEQYI